MLTGKVLPGGRIGIEIVLLNYETLPKEKQPWLNGIIPPINRVISGTVKGDLTFNL